MRQAFTSKEMVKVTEDRKRFEVIFNNWAKTNGYVLKKFIWRNNDHYLTCDRPDNNSKFRVQKRAFKTGELIEHIYLEY